MRFRVVLPKFPWSACLSDLADCVAHALSRAGHHVVCSEDFAPEGEAFNVLLGAHNKLVVPPPRAIIYQTEAPGTVWFTENYRARLNAALMVWDAAPGFGTSAHVIEPGLCEWARLPVAPKTLDLLFYGSLTDRRIALLQKLSDAGLNIEAHFGVFGDKRNELIARAKVVVDVKQRDGDPNDKTRTFFLDSVGACVLSENDENPGRALSPTRIVAQCRELLDDPERRRVHTESRRAELKPTDATLAVCALQTWLNQAAPSNGASHHPV
jgi:hypothetical protein